MPVNLKMSLIVGFAFFILGFIISLFESSPIVSAFVYLIAGIAVVSYQKITRQNNVSNLANIKASLMSGLVSGMVIASGNLVVFIVDLAYLLNSGDQPPFEGIFIYGGIILEICFGVFGVVISGIGGALAGYLFSFRVVYKDSAEDKR